MIDTTIKHRLEDLTDNYAEFVTSDFAREAAQVMGQEAGLDENQIIILRNGIILYLLVFFNNNDLVNFIAQECQLSVQSAQQLTQAIIASLPEGVVQAHDISFATLKHNSSTEPVSNQALKTAKPTTPKTVTQPQPTTEPTYSSTQEAILKEGRANDKTNSPRWGDVGQ